MALTAFQRRICRLIAQNRLSSGESYIAGGTALNALLKAPRISGDIDIFHDTTEALRRSWEQDRNVLTDAGFQISILRETPAYVQALAQSAGERVLMEWARDSAFRFFPLVEDEQMGLTLHPFDLATNKVLALAGRLEIRDWIDVQECSRSIQHLGLLIWAACGKDPGFSPPALLNEASRSSHYSQEEMNRLDFGGAIPDIGALSRQWKATMKEARDLIEMLPAEQAGQCLLTRSGALFTGTTQELKNAIESGKLFWHQGTVGGVLPTVTNM